MHVLDVVDVGLTLGLRDLSRLKDFFSAFVDDEVLAAVLVHTNGI